MKILVGFKRVIDYHLTARPKADGSNVDLNGVKMSPNPFDEIALEEALKLKEKGIVGEVIALGIGDTRVPETLRTALAMGADRAIHVPFDGEADGLSIAEVFAEVAQKEGVKLVLLGKQAIDTDHGQTPSQTAELLGWPQALNAYQMKVEGDSAEVVCEIDGGLETLAFSLPAVVSVDLRLNTPRFVSMPNIIKARAKPIETHAAAVRPAAIKLAGVSVPPQVRKNEMVETVDQLVAKLEGVK